MVGVDEGEWVGGDGKVGEEGVGMVGDCVFEGGEGGVMGFLCDVVEVEEGEMCEGGDVVVGFWGLEDGG